MSYDGFYGELSSRGTANDALNQITDLKNQVIVLAADAEASATNSEDSAATSSVKASESAVSAASALLSENAARVSEVNAGVSAQQALSATSRFCGAFETAPSTRLDGSALQDGDEYQNTVTNLRYTWSGDVWMALNGTVDTDLRDVLASTDGADFVGVQQIGEGAAARTLQDKSRELLTPLDYLAVGDGVTYEDANFAALEVSHKGKVVDMLGKTYLVSSRPTGNKYVNGKFLVNGAVEGEVPNDQLLYARGSTKMWAQWPTSWAVEAFNSRSASIARNTAPSAYFGAMIAVAGSATFGFPDDWVAVPGNRMVFASAQFAYVSAPLTQPGGGLVIEAIDTSGVVTQKLFPLPVAATSWKLIKHQYRLPVRTVKYRVGVYRVASTEVARLLFSDLRYGRAAESKEQIGGGQQVGRIAIRRDVAFAYRLMHNVRIGPSPKTAVQSFCQAPYTEVLYIGSGHEVVPGSGVDALVVEIANRGPLDVTNTEYQSPLLSSDGHSGLSYEMNENGSVRLWSGGSEPGTAVRFKYGGSAAGGEATNVSVHKLFDTRATGGTFPTVTPDQRWLVAVGRNSTNSQVVRVWDLQTARDGSATPDLLPNQFIYEWDIPYEILGENYPIQGVASDGAHVFIVTGGFSAGTPGSIKLGQFTLTGETVAILDDVQVGAEDYAANGGAWEPEGLGLYQEGPTSEFKLAMGLVTGVGATKHHTIWVFGGGGSELLTSRTRLQTTGAVGVAFSRTDSSKNAYYEATTQAGSVFFGNGDGASFVVNNTSSAKALWMRVTDTFAQFKGYVKLGGPLLPFQVTLATLPTAAAFNGYLITVTNATGGAKVCRSDGTNWLVLNTNTVVS